MTTQEEKIRVNARVPKSLYDWICSEYDNVSQAINEGLEELKESKTSGSSYNTVNVIQSSHTDPGSIIPDDTSVIRDVISEPNPVIQDDIQLLKTLMDEQKNRIENYKTQVQTLNAEIARLQNVVMEAPRTK